MQTHNSNPQSAFRNPQSAIRNPQSSGSALPRPGSITAQVTARQTAQALANLDHTIRSEALKCGADRPQAESLVLEARCVFTLINAIPIARDSHGETLLGPNGFPLTPEDWLRTRLNAQ